jgi:hypothetical protein
VRSGTTWPEAFRLRITRFVSLTEPRFFGCVSAFADSLAGELNSATAALRRLESCSKGAAFAFEIEFDRHRYGASIVLDRWATFIGAFGLHLPFPRAASIVGTAAERVAAAEAVLAKANALVDAAESYSAAVVEACQLAFQSVQSAFAEESRAAAEDAKLGPMLAEEYTSARRIFLEDLAER